MGSILRDWNCRGCGRANNTVIEPDGTVTCEYCADVKSIQPSRSRGGETPWQLSRFHRPHPVGRRSPGNPGPDEPSAADVGPRDDSERRDAFLRMREAYGEAQRFVSTDGSYADLGWILGAHRDATQNPPALETKAIELAALWLQDLASEVDSRLPASEETSRSLRDATARFLLAFRSPSEVPAGDSEPPRFEGGFSR